MEGASRISLRTESASFMLRILGKRGINSGLFLPKVEILFRSLMAASTASILAGRRMVKVSRSSRIGMETLLFGFSRS